jgi:1,4-dihydroxy-2-naphthoate polyprenyltransferase
MNVSGDHATASPAPRLTVPTLVRALRLPFLGASVLPFVAGSLLPDGRLRAGRLAAGLALVACNHLGANLINDYADSRSGADWMDRRFFGYFGGSKLIQEGVLTERFYLLGAMACFLIGLALAIGLAFALHGVLVLALYAAILFLSCSYSVPPLRLAYRRLGEVVIFLLFGPALVMGGTTVQTAQVGFPASLRVSLPFGLLTAAILFVNEVPDFPEDAAAGKRNWVSLVGPARAFYIAGLLFALALASVVAAFFCGDLGWVALAVVLLLPLMLQVVRILRQSYADKAALVQASKLTIGIQTAVTLLIILDRLVR